MDEKRANIVNYMVSCIYRRPQMNVDNKYTILAEDLATKWMRGMRQGRPGDPKRPAHKHPEDLVKLLKDEYPGKVSDGILQVAWLHDILEDGVKDDGTRVFSEDLDDLGFKRSVICDIDSLTKRQNESKVTYLTRLKTVTHNSPRVPIVKCVDRICNLREGLVLFDDDRWARYVGETFYFILPLTRTLEGYEQAWLRQELIDSATARPVR